MENLKETKMNMEEIEKMEVVEETITFEELEEMEDVVNGGTTGFGICCQFVS